ncbi:uncharacterized protein EI90DRAFT_3027557 [Cantharellus anzutake]|uniref:uncharacterized protein n=1 Tax=Cantharellus anzutake TaxID=1750568 RepID=UPI001908F5A2|nr:uncharacterized protein EI90DRAFT_3027557 [Cantharellus anzutake]KAF8343915.1 hypothetical protein EI90DRAFT_3027557 [Cantharellus anzutake]
MVLSAIAISAPIRKRKILEEHPISDSTRSTRAVKRKCTESNDQFLPKELPQSLDLLSQATYTAPVYPRFDLYPDFAYDEMDVDPPHTLTALSTHESMSTFVGLRQPRENFPSNHHTCSQIPKLQVAKHPGLNGHRALYTLCPQCGAINKVEEAWNK